MNFKKNKNGPRHQRNSLQRRGKKPKQFSSKLSRNKSITEGKISIEGSQAANRRQERLSNESRDRRRLYLGKATVLIVTIVVVAWGVVFSNIAGVSSDSILSEERTERLNQATSEYLSQTTSWRASFDHSNYENYLSLQLPEFRQISAMLPLFSRDIQVEFIEHEPAIQWQSAGRKYLVSPEGVIMGFVDTSSNIEAQKTPTVFDEAGVQLQPGDRIVSPEFVQYILDSQQAIIAQGYTPKAYRITSSTRVVRIDTEEEDFEVVSSVEIQPAGQWRSVKDLLKTLSKQNRSKPTSFVDTRVAGRIFWK